MLPRKATVEDYRRLQGGMPEVLKDSKGLWHIKHTYREGAPDVRSHKPPDEGEEININGVLFNARLMWDFHGKPCEGQSRSVGGYGYSREGGERRKA